MYYKNALTQWSENIAATESRDYENRKKTILVAIARKGPRLCELEYKRIKECLKYEYIISEHAIPFSLSDFADSLVILMDEAVYFGTTFQRIHTVLQTGASLSYASSASDKEKMLLKAAPIVISDKASILLKERMEWLIPNIPLIKEEDTTEYINSLIEEFYTLGKPFDIEFPILYAHTPKEWEQKSNQEIAEELKKILDTVNLDETMCPQTYKLHHKNSSSGNDYYTVTRLLSDNIYQNNKTVHSDFIKIRTFWTKNKIAFTFYAPNIIDDRLLTQDTPLFKGTPLMEIWDILWKEAHKVTDKITETQSHAIKNNVHDINYNLEEYLYHTKRSLLIWANYLCSFALATRLVPSLKEKLYNNGQTNVSTFLPEDTDVCYLCGKNLLKDIYSRLKDLISSKEKIILPTVPLEDVQISNHIPDSYKESYDLKNIQDLPKCENMSQLVSTLFFNMHYQVELKGRENWKEDLARLRFGETFSSIYNRGFIRDFNEDIYTSMHKAIDFRIDNGSIVPKYIYYKDNNGINIWSRVFRCGENEDFYNQKLIRFMTRILLSIKEIYGNTLLPKQLIYGLFSVYFLPSHTTKSIFEDENLPWDFVCQWKNFGPEVFFLNELGDKEDNRSIQEKQMTDLTEFCISRNLLKESDVDGYYIVTPDLPPAIDNWKELTKEKLKYITLFLTKEMKGLSIQDITEWLFYDEKVMRDTRRKLLRWCEKYPELTDECMTNFSFISEFNDLNLTYPWKEVEVLTKLNELSINNDNSNQSRTKLQQWIEFVRNSWSEQIRMVLNIKNFKINREIGDMMCYLLTCCFFYNRNKEKIRPYAQKLDEYTSRIGDISLAECSFEKCIDEEDLKSLKKAYKSFIGTVINEINNEENNV